MSFVQTFDSFNKIYAILDTFQASQVSISEFLIDLLRFTQEFESKYTILVHDLFQNVGSVLTLFAEHPRSKNASVEWAMTLSTRTIIQDVQRLTDKTSGLHFNAKNAKAHQIREFASGKLVSQMSTSAPYLWSVMQNLLDSYGVPNDCKDFERQKKIIDVVCNSLTSQTTLPDLFLRLTYRKLLFTSEVCFMQTIINAISSQQ